ncbi:hypothetical protein V8C43DRAFT_273674 [Trichoderma afarasin]
MRIAYTTHRAVLAMIVLLLACQLPVILPGIRAGLCPEAICRSRTEQSRPAHGYQSTTEQHCIYQDRPFQHYHTLPIGLRVRLPNCQRKR